MVTTVLIAIYLAVPIQRTSYTFYGRVDDYRYPYNQGQIDSNATCHFAFVKYGAHFRWNYYNPYGARPRYYTTSGYRKGFLFANILMILGLFASCFAVLLPKYGLLTCGKRHTRLRAQIATSALFFTFMCNLIALGFFIDFHANTRCERELHSQLDKWQITVSGSYYAQVKPEHFGFLHTLSFVLVSQLIALVWSEKNLVRSSQTLGRKLLSAFSNVL